MTRLRKDVEATILTALIVLAYVATHEGWNVPLIGDDHRWATAVILILGASACGLGSAEDGTSKIAAGLGILAAVLAVAALVTGSLTPLSLLVADIVALWALSTARHAVHAPHRPAAT